MSLSTEALVMLDVLYGLVPDDESLTPDLTFGVRCRERGLDYETQRLALGELVEAGLVESERHEYGTKSILYRGFVKRQQAEDILFSSVVPAPGVRSRRSALAERCAA